jgi:hypothetical protein
MSVDRLYHAIYRLSYLVCREVFWLWDEIYNGYVQARIDVFGGSTMVNGSVNPRGGDKCKRV